MVKDIVTFILPNSIKLDLSQAITTLGRIREVESVTLQKAPELLARFVESYLDLSKNLSTLRYERSKAEQNANKVRSVVVLDRAIEILKTKGYLTPKSPTGNEDLRQAVLDADLEYQAALDRVRDIDLAVEMVHGMLDSIEMAYTAIKKLLDPNLRFNNPNLNGSEENSGFGKARY